MEKMKYWLSLLEKIFLIIVAVGIVFYFLLILNFWADGWKGFFLEEGNIENFIYLSLFLFVLTFIFKKLLIWEVHLTLGNPHKKRRQ
jgi:hypothetical protein